MTVLFNAGECRVLGYGVIAVGNGSAYERVGAATVEGVAAVAHRELPDRSITALEAALAVGGEEYCSVLAIVGCSHADTDPHI